MGNIYATEETKNTAGTGLTTSATDEHIYYFKDS